MGSLVCVSADLEKKELVEVAFPTGSFHLLRFNHSIVLRFICTMLFYDANFLELLEARKVFQSFCKGTE